MFSVTYVRVQMCTDVFTQFFNVQYINSEARGGAVVEALRYKPEGHGIDARGWHWNFLFT
jgi:hypothetical protein